MQHDTMISVRGVSKKYALYKTPMDRLKEALSLSHTSRHTDFFALREIGFDVKRGETVGIVGTNGSGKSTILKIITGVLKPTEGEVEVEGRISALLELGAGFNQEYTGLQNIYLNGRMMGYTRKQMEGKVQDIIDFAEIGPFIDQPVKTYSSGMFARLAFAVAINVEPDILIVDEALSVGDLFFQNKCFRKFDELKQKGVTILFVSHDISSVRQMCSRAVWIEKGKQIIFDESDKVCDMYMDMKRLQMNENAGETDAIDTDAIPTAAVAGPRLYPPMKEYETKFHSTQVEVLACFFTNRAGKPTATLEVDHTYSAHIVFACQEEMNNLIAGFVLENEKGLPLFDINNFINQQQTMHGKKDTVVEAIYEFRLPRVMKGMYVLSTAIAQGVQEKHTMLTWLHGVDLIEIVNRGYNSSYIEIPAKISVDELRRDQVGYLETT